MDRAPAEIAPLTRPEVAATAALLGRALDDDPGWRHVFPDPARRARRLPALFARVIAAHYLAQGACEGVPGAAAAIWAPPGGHALPWWRSALLAPRLGWLVRGRILAAIRLYRAIERRAPREPHYYLAILGVDPGHQGRGLGGALVGAMLDRCDAARTLAWLESANPQNHAFYRRLGFETADQLAIPGGPTITWFARRPR